MDSMQPSLHEYERFFAQSISLFCLASPDGYFRQLNAAWEKTLGFSREELLSRPFIEFVHPDDRVVTLDQFNLLNAGIDAICFENRYLCKDDSYRWLRWDATISPERHLVYAVAHDITTHKQTSQALVRQTQELARANAELTRSNQELDAFAYIASHDLKEPLRGLANYSTFLLEDYREALNAEGRAKLETLPRLTQRMEALIDSLLHYSRVGRVDLAIAETDIGQVLEEVCESLSIFLREGEVEIRIPAKLPVVRCDKVRVGEVFRNLITNAMKYNDSPHKWIEIGVVEIPPDSSSTCRKELLNPQAEPPWVFYVRDNGIGIREKHHEAIFRIFKRLHGRDKYYGGTGAGLTIVKKIIERHGGRIWVTSAPGNGTTFYFTLEREEGRGDAPEATEPIDLAG